MRLLTLAFLILSFSACSQVDCHSLHFGSSTFKEAVQNIENARFKKVDHVDTSKSSWVRGASYYSCDGKVGYFILKTDKQSYLHQQLPLSVWQEFKQAHSFGDFYNKNIRKRYRFQLSN